MNTHPEPRLAPKLIGTVLFLALFLWELNSLVRQTSTEARWLTYLQLLLYGCLVLWSLLRCVRAHGPGA